MSEEKEDPILAAPQLEKDESIGNDEPAKNIFTYDQRRISLLNNPNYGVILAFLDKFRSHIDLEDYPFHQLEENLLSDEENINRHLIDFHLTLLKRISLGKGANRDKFVSIITKFAYRFDYEDGEYLKSNGYSQAQIDIKLRILKNLLETQFEHNQAFKTALLEKPAFEVRSQPFGRDRSGAFYWLFRDSECFIRLFREETNDERGWTNIAKDKDELEKFIVLLITDHVVRKKFPEWKFSHEPFNALTTSTDFEERYAPITMLIKKEEIVKTSTMPLDPIKVENQILLSPPCLSTIKNEICPVTSSNEEEKHEINNNQTDRKRKKSRGRRKSSKKRRTTSKKDESQTKVVEPPPPPSVSKGRKRKEIIVEEEEEPTPSQPATIDEESIPNENLPIALRRSRRIRKAPTNELPPVTSSPTKSLSQTPTKKKFPNGKTKASSQPGAPPTKGKGRKRRRGAASSSDEHQPTEDEDEDEYNSDDYLPDKKQIDEFDGVELFEEEEDEDEYVPRRSAKTVAKRHGQSNVEDLPNSSSACGVCSKTDRPESLLLCDDCDDAYHLECVKPPLIAVPDGDWFCPLCEHKRFSEKLIEKFIQLIKDYEELEVKRNQCISKRTNRLANVMLNLDRMVKKSTTKKSRVNGIVYSDDDEEEEEEEEEENDSVYGFQDEPKVKSPKRINRLERENSEENQMLGVRSCRRKPQNYRFDDYDKKMKEAMMQSGVDDKDSEESQDEKEEATTKQRKSYEKDEDFDAKGGKNDDEFAPDAERSDESESEAEDDDLEEEESSDEGWKNKRRTSTRKKSNNTKSTRRKSRRISDDDDSLSETELRDFQTNDDDDDRRRSSRTAATKNYGKQQDVPSDEEEEEEEEDLRPPPRRMRYKKRRASDDSFVDEDDYEKIAQKREIVKHSKTAGRSTITDHLKKLVDTEENSLEKKETESTMNNEETSESSKTMNKTSSTNYEQVQLSDDDDFPDEQEIFKPNGLLSLKKNINGPPATAMFRPAFMPPTHSYQHAIIDPTARFAMIRPAVRPMIPMGNGYPPFNGPLAYQQDANEIPQYNGENTNTTLITTIDGDHLTMTNL